tara:strand:- start:1180 stop:1395 length:216 start_codon:yes stop_codon:yes gene_type:complete
MNPKDIGTHVHVPSKLVFFIEKCENCGNNAQAANAITVPNAEQFDFIPVIELPPEQYYSDDLGHCACEDCI